MAPGSASTERFPRPVRRASRERVRSRRPGKVGRAPGASTGTAAAVRPGTLVAGTATVLRPSSPPAGGADVARSSTEVPPHNRFNSPSLFPQVNASATGQHMTMTQASQRAGLRSRAEAGSRPNNGTENPLDCGFSPAVGNLLGLLDEVGLALAEPRVQRCRNEDRGRGTNEDTHEQRQGKIAKGAPRPEARHQ